MELEIDWELVGVTVVHGESDTLLVNDREVDFEILFVTGIESELDGEWLPDSEGNLVEVLDKLRVDVGEGTPDLEVDRVNVEVFDEVLVRVDETDFDEDGV